MTKRWTALILALAMALALGAGVVSAEDDAPAAAPPGDAAGTLSFADLGARMLKNNYSMLALQESIDDIESHDYKWKEDDLRDKLNGVASLQWMVITSSPFASAALSAAGMSGASEATLQSTYDSLRTQFDAIRDGETQRDDADSVRKYRQMQDLMVMGAETLYIAILSIDESDAALTRNAEALERALAALRVSLGNGLVSALNVQQAENGLTQLKSGQETLRMTEETTLLQLKAMVGAELGEPLALGALPRVTAAELEAMDLEADLARAKEASYDLYDARKQIDDFKEDYYDPAIDALGSNSKAFEVSQVKHALQALKYQYEGAAQSFELKFRTLYAQIGDNAQKLDAARSALALEEKNYAASALKCEQGAISRNALADAADTLADARDKVSSAERELFTSYRSYYWAVEHGVMT